MRAFRTAIAAVAVVAMAVASPARAGGVNIVQVERAWAQWSGGAGCVRSFVHVLAARAHVLDPPGAPVRSAVAWVSVVRADACTGAVYESSHGRVLSDQLRLRPGAASLRATVPLLDAVTGTTRSVRVEVDWLATGTQEASLVEHDQGTVRFEVTVSQASAHGSVVRDAEAVASGVADTAGIMTSRRLAAGANV